MEEKVDENTLNALLASKVSNQEINDILPDMSMYEHKFSSQIEEGIENLMIKLEEKFETQDLRMNKIRNEFDMNSLSKFIGGKADQKAVTTSFKDQEFKIMTLDKNIVAIASDFETF